MHREFSGQSPGAAVAGKYLQKDLRGSQNEVLFARLESRETSPFLPEPAAAYTTW